MFDSSIFVKKMWALKRWCVTKVAHCMSSAAVRIDNLVIILCCLLQSGLELSK